MIRAFGFLKKASAKVNKEFVWMQMLLIISKAADEIRNIGFTLQRLRGTNI